MTLCEIIQIRTRVTRGLLTLLAATTAVVAGCASASNGAQAKAARCVPADRDTVFAAAGPVYRDCAVDVRARNVTRSRVDYRPSSTSLPRSACYSAELEFVVNTKGVPETNTAHVVHSNEQGFADAVLASLSGWEYEPARLGDVAVRQIVSEKAAMATMTVLVPKGASPSSQPTQRPPTC